MSTLGLRYAGLYLLWPISWLLLAFTSGSDDDSETYIQTGMLPQMLTLDVLDLVDWADELWWGWVYLAVVPPAVVAAYLLGVLVEHLLPRAKQAG